MPSNLNQRWQREEKRTRWPWEILSPRQFSGYAFHKERFKVTFGSFPDKFKTACLQADNSLWRSCQQTLIHVLCSKFHQEALIPFFVWTAFCDRLLLSSWAHDSLMQLETTDAREPCSHIELWEADSSAGVWGRRCRALVGGVPLSFKLTHLQIHYLSVQFRRSIMSAFWAHGLQHTRPPCPSPTPRVYSNSCPLSRWCHPTISSSVVPFSSCLQSFPATGSSQMSQFFESGGQSIGVSASSSVLPMNIQDWYPLGWTGWISLQSKGLSRVFSNTTVQKHQLFGSQLSLWSNSHIPTWLLGKS